jgi:hypothetical protein
MYLKYLNKNVFKVMYIFLIIAYFYSSMKLEKSTDQVLPVCRECGEGGGRYRREK